MVLHAFSRFNLLGEILSVQANAFKVSPNGYFGFQSLGRDSVCSSLPRETALAALFPVSISWARFCLFKRGVAPKLHLFQIGFNLLGEILSVQAGTMVVLWTEELFVSISWARFCLFKPRLLTTPAILELKFQSLGRDSVCSSITRTMSPTS